MSVGGIATSKHERGGKVRHRSRKKWAGRKRTVYNFHRKNYTPKRTVYKKYTKNKRNCKPQKKIYTRKRQKLYTVEAGPAQSRGQKRLAATSTGRRTMWSSNMRTVRRSFGTHTQRPPKSPWEFNAETMSGKLQLSTTSSEARKGRQTVCQLVPAH